MTALYTVRRFGILLLTVFVLSVPFVYSVEGAGTSNTGGGTTNSGGGVVTPKAGETTELTNPLKAESISEFLIAIVDVLLIFATPIIVLYIMYAGFKFVTAQGNPSEIESARTALLWAVVGGVIVLGAKLILEVIQGTIEAFNTTP